MPTTFASELKQRLASGEDLEVTRAWYFEAMHSDGCDWKQWREMSPEEVDFVRAANEDADRQYQLHGAY